MNLRTSSIFNHFIDTNVLLQHANNDSGIYSDDIATILAEATGTAPKRKLWVSSVLFAELRPSSFAAGKFGDIEDLARYIRSIATIVSPDPNTMLRAARLRDLKWARANRHKDEIRRCMTLGDAMHLVSALWVKEADRVPDLEFLTFDNKSEKSPEADSDTKTLPLLSLDDYTDGLGNDPDVAAVVRLPRIRPILGQSRLDV